MTTDKEHNCRDEERTTSNIEEFGLSVVAIERADYLPSFAYSIGLWKKYGHPELISFGLTTKTLHEVINLAADIVKSGQRLETGKVYTDFLKQGNQNLYQSTNET